MPKVSKFVGVLTAEEFSATVTAFPHLSEKGQQVARAVLVERKTFQDVEREFDVSRAHAHQWVKKVFEGYRPKGWVTAVISLPEPLMEQVQTMVKRERELWTQAQSSKKSQVKAS
jgi:transposase-like protein